jgi:hypothetical protein
MSTDPTFALSMAVVTAAAMLAVFHVADVNEKEPGWAVGLLLMLGFGTGVASANLAEGEFRREFLGAPASAEAATLAAILLGLAVFRVLRSTRGWSELNGVIDGVVYGAAAGLGVALGSILVDELDGSALVARLADQPDAFALVWESMRETAYQGLFGAITGAGIGAAVEATRWGRRVLLALAGPTAALTVQYLSEGIRGDASSAPASPRQWLALLVPVVVVAGIVMYGLRRESQALRRLAQDDATVITAEEYSSLTRPRALRKEYLRLFGSGDLEKWDAQRSLHNRQLQLAMAKRRAGGDTEETEALRDSIVDLRQKLQSGPGSPDHRV